MKRLVIAAFALSALALPVQAQNHETAPPAGAQGQWFTTADGCSYSRTSSGWYLIQNPHHIGQPPAHRGCAPVL